MMGEYYIEYGCLNQNVKYMKMKYFYYVNKLLNFNL